MNWTAGNKVFKTEEEAESYAKEMAKRGIIWCIAHETEKPVTHRHLGQGYTEEV